METDAFTRGQVPWRGTQRRVRRAFLAGFLAAAIMTLAMVLIRLGTGVVSLPEILGEGTIRTMPAEAFSKILDTLQRAAKPTLEIGIVLGQLAFGGLLGRLYARQPTWKRALAIVGVLWIVVGLLLLPLLGVGFFGAAFRVGAAAVGGTLLASFLIYAAALVWLHALLTGSPLPLVVPMPAIQRRVALRWAGYAVAAIAVGAVGWRALRGEPDLRSPRGAPDGPDAPSAPGQASSTIDEAPTATRARFSPAPGEPAGEPFNLLGLSPEVTPTRDFYTVSKNFVDPSVDVRTWSLRIDGHVQSPMTLDYETIVRLSAVSGFHTLQCVSNPVGGDLWGNAHWTGVRLRDLLAQAGLRPGARKVVFHAADDYTDSVTLARALDEGAILAYGMNGAPLERAHGYPARLLIPGIYGMKNVKWVTRIELVDFDFKGYWMQRGWSDTAVYKTSSRIDVPGSYKDQPPGEVALGGVAYAGDRGISVVEYSVDDGKSWRPARLRAPLGANTWQLWSAREALAPGLYFLKVRAVDGKGDRQSARGAEPFPDGASGYHDRRLIIS